MVLILVRHFEDTQYVNHVWGGQMGGVASVLCTSVKCKNILFASYNSFQTNCAFVAKCKQTQLKCVKIFLYFQSSLVSKEIRKL